MKRLWCLVSAAALLLCPLATHADEPLPVVASFSILADMTRQIGGERIQVHSLVGENGDPHAFQPSPSDARRIVQAKLVVINGLGFEGWIDRLVKSSGYRGKLVVASAGIRLLSRPHTDHGKHAGHDDEADPHGWQDAGNALRYVDNIAAALVQIDPAGKSIYEANAARYKREIQSLDDFVRQTIAAIPKERRRVVTSHDAFGYFSRAYGIEFIAPVGVNADAEPSARDIARLIKQIRSERIPAVFMENISDSRQLERIRAESGARLGGTLFSDSLSKNGGPAATYLDMMRHNAMVLSVSLQK